MIVVSNEDFPLALEELKAVMRVGQDEKVHYISEIDGQEVCYYSPLFGKYPERPGITGKSINKTFE